VCSLITLPWPGDLKGAEPDPATAPAAPAPDEPAAAKPRDLGPPLVDQPETLRKLDRGAPVWLDLKHKQVVLLGEMCDPKYPLEFFATYPMRSYESVLAVQVKPSVVHAALLALGAQPGHPAQVEPKFEPASGSEISIEVRWKDKQGARRQARAQDWIRDVKTKKAMDLNWVFAGSKMWKDESTGKNVYLADSAGDFISVLNLPNTTLDLPIRSAGALESRLFEAFTERLPPPHTPVTLVLKPVKK
jgi:hypothetical protein